MKKIAITIKNYRDEARWARKRDKYIRDDEARRAGKRDKHIEDYEARRADQTTGRGGMKWNP